jgi:hypothetical protein
MTKTITLLLFGLFYWLPLMARAQNKPDLVITAPFTVPGNVLTGSVYSMSAVIKNQGTNGSQFNCIGYYLSTDNVWDATDAYLGASCQSLMFPGQSGPCSITATIPPLTPTGNQFILLVADPLNAEQELDETNNVTSFGVTVAPGNGSSLPDLELWRPSISFSAVPPGGSTGAFTFIFNRGPGAAGAYEIGFYLSADTVFSAGTDAFLGVVTGSGLSTPSGTIHSAPVLAVPATTPPGNYYLVLVADPRNLVSESNENNNSRALALRVTSNVTASTPAETAGLEIYPNPVARGTALRIVLGNGKQTQLQLECYDATGRLVTRQSATSVVHELDTQMWPTGIYYVRLVGRGVVATRRVVVK